MINLTYRHKAALLPLLGMMIMSLCGTALASEPLMLGLDEAVTMSLELNLDMHGAGLFTNASQADVTVLQGEFDPAIVLEASKSYTKTKPFSTLYSDSEDVLEFGASIGGKVRTGTEYELKWGARKTRLGQTPFLDLNPYYDAGLTLSVSQPLLKGRGKSIQQSRLEAAKNTLAANRLRQRDTGMDVVMATTDSYWGLYLSRESLHVAELSLTLAQNLLKEVRARIDAGALAPVEAYKSEAETALRREKLLRAEKAVLDAGDRLKAAMGFTDWQREIVPIDDPMALVQSNEEGGEAQQPGGSLEEALDEAFINRGDYKSALLELSSAEALMRLNKNMLLPELNLLASAGLNGLGDGYADALDKVTSRDYTSWGAGLSFVLPFGNRAAKGRYQKSRANYKMAELNLRAVELAITLAVREAYRGVRLAVEALGAAEKARVASHKSLDAEQERFRLGLTTANEVLRSQEDYTDALYLQKRAAAEHARATTALKRAKGTLLQ